MDLSPIEAAPAAAMAESMGNGNFFGVFGGCILQGWLLHLAARYYQLPACKTERMTVTVGMCCATVATGLLMSDVYNQTVVHYYNFETMGFVPWRSGSNCILGGLVVLCVQAVFGYRLIRLHPENRFVACIISFIVFATIMSHTPWTQYLYKANWTDMQDFDVHVTPFLYIEYGMTAFTDVVICVGTLWSLTGMGRAALPQTASRLRKLSYYAVEGMVLPTLCAVLAIVLKVTRPQNSEHWIFLYWQNKISLIVLLQVLLSREQLSEDAGISIPPRSFSSSAGNAKSSAFAPQRSLTESQVATDNGSALELGNMKA